MVKYAPINDPRSCHVEAHIRPVLPGLCVVVVKDVAAAPALKGRLPCTCGEEEEEEDEEEDVEKERGVSTSVLCDALHCCHSTFPAPHHHITTT